MRECELCGTPFEPIRWNHRFCSKCNQEHGHPGDIAKARDRAVARHMRQFQPEKPVETIEWTCRYCGKVHRSNKATGQAFSRLSSACLVQYNDEHIRCAECGRLLAEVGIHFPNVQTPKNPYCSDECRLKHEWQIAREAGRIRNCKQCGEEFIARSETNVFCCASCAHQYQRDHSIDPTRYVDAIIKCRWCGKEFVRKAGSRSTFCSSSCRHAFVGDKAHKKHLAETLSAEEATAPAASPTPTEKPTEKTKDPSVPSKPHKKYKKHPPLPGTPVPQDEEQETSTCSKSVCINCCTVYASCVWMASKFKAYPIGATYNHGAITSCPLYTPPKT